MVHTLSFMTIMIVCITIVRPDSHSASTASTTPTTMDSLEAHVWTDKEAHTLAVKYDSVIFVLFRDNTMFTRRYTRQHGWWPLIAAPFYFYTPGVENKTDIRVYYPDTIPLFRFDRIGKQQSGRFLVYDYSSYPYPRLADTNGDQQRLKLRKEGLSPLARGISIITLNSSLIQLRGNSDFFPCIQSETLHATTSPFPWDDNLKHFDYPIQEDARGAISPADIKRRKTVKKKKTLTL